MLNLLFSQEPMPGFLIGSLCKSLARICRLGWIEIGSINTIITSIQQLMDQNFALAEIGLKFFEEIIIEIVEPIKNRSILISKRVALKFRDEGLTNILSQSIFILLNNKELSDHAYTMLLKLINLSLSFDFSGISSDESIEDPNSLQIPLAWKQYIENQELLQIIERFIINNFELEYICIRVLNQLGAIRRSIFQDQQQKKNYIFAYCSVLINVMKEKELSGDSLFEFIQAMKRFFANFLVKDISEAVNFKMLLENLGQFTVKLLNNPTTLISVDYNSLLVWSYLSFEGHHQSNLISEYIPLIFDIFLERSLGYISQEYFSLENEHETKEQLQNLAIFSIYYYPEVYNLLTKKFVEENNFIQSSITRAYNISWIIHIGSAIISTDNKKTGNDLNDSLVQLIISISSKITHTEYCIKQSMIRFYQSFVKTYLNSSIDDFWGDSSSIIGDMSIGNITRIIIENLIQNLYTYSEGKILEESILLFESICSGYYSSKIIVTIPESESLLSYPTYPISNKKLLKQLLSILTKLWTSKETNPYNFYNSLIEKWKNADDRVENLQNMITEMHGICMVLNTSQDYLEFFDTIYDKILDILDKSRYFLQDPSSAYCLLKFLKEFLDNRNGRIKFSIYDSYGIILFKSISPILIQYRNNKYSINAFQWKRKYKKNKNHYWYY